MSADLIEFPTTPAQIEPATDYHKTLHDLGIAMLVLELIADGWEPSADLRRLAENAYLRLSDLAERLKQPTLKEAEKEAENRILRPSQTAATVSTQPN